MNNYWLKLIEAEEQQEQQERERAYRLWKELIHEQRKLALLKAMQGKKP